MCEKLLFTLFYCSYALMHCSWHWSLKRKKKKKAQNAQTCQNVDVNVDPNPHNKLGFMLYVSVWTESLKLYSINACVCGESLKICNINVRMCVLKAWNCVRACVCVFKSCKLYNINKCFESLKLYNIKVCVCVLKAGSFII